MAAVVLAPSSGLSLMCYRLLYQSDQYHIYMHKNIKEKYVCEKGRIILEKILW